MKVMVGDIFKNFLDESEYIVKKIVNRMVVLESQDGEKQILTEVDNLKSNLFYQKRGDIKP